jgi:site-specific recombinase XerD
MTNDPRYRRLNTHLRFFFTDYLKVQRGLSINTLRSYRDTWRLLFRYGCEKRGMQKPEQWRLNQVDRALILDFLVYLEEECQVSARTRNCRLAALHAFFTYLAGSEPSLELHCRRILTIPTKRTRHAVVGFLDSDELEAVLRSVPKEGALARRDLALLVFAYNTGARVSEIAQTRLNHIIPGPSPCIRILGKGNRERIVPLWEGTLHVIESYIRHYRVPPHDPTEASYLFLGNGGKRLTRFHVGRIITGYFKKASVHCPAMRKKKLCAHSMRHSTAVHLLQGGAEMNTIKAWLGHSSVESVEVYLGLDLRKKRDVLDRLITPEFGKLIAKKNIESTKDNHSFTQWLESL